MERISLATVMFIISASSLSVAVLLTGASTAKSVKSNLYNTKTNFGYGNQYYTVYAYQTLWEIYDENKHSNDPLSVQAYKLIIKNDEWRVLARMLVFGAVGLGFLSAVVLIIVTLITKIKTGLRIEGVLVNVASIVSSVFSIAAGALLAFTLQYYEQKYRTLLTKFFFDPNSHYPYEDFVSTGFYMAAMACGLYFISAIINIVNVMIYFFVKRPKSAVKPINQNSDATPEEVKS